MRIETCQFVISSELFEGLNELAMEFSESDPPFSWGDNNRSLVTINDILNHIANSGIELDEQVSVLSVRAEELAEGVNTYVDLEN